MCEAMGRLAFLPASIGFMVGILMLLLLDRLIPHLHLGSDKTGGTYVRAQEDDDAGSGGHTSQYPGGHGSRSGICRILSRKERHHACSGAGASFGIAIVNFPEGSDHFPPLRSESGMSRKKAFEMGTLSGIVELIGALATIAAYRYPNRFCRFSWRLQQGR